LNVLVLGEAIGVSVGGAVIATADRFGSWWQLSGGQKGKVSMGGATV